MPMHFCDLPADVILSIFGAHCDISSVVSAAQTSRYLHVLGFDKSVWLALLTDLKRRNFLEQGYTPVLQELSTEELINLVKRILTGPETWSLQQNGCVNPQIAKQILLHPTVTRGRLPNQNLTDYKLVCGGRYCLYNSNNIIECWDVAEDILLWTHEQAARGDTTVFDFAAEAQNDGDFLMVMTCLLEDGLPAFEIIYLNCRTWYHTLLLRHSIPEDYYDFEFSSAVICGDLCAVALELAKDKYLIIDWRSQSSLVLCNSPDNLFLLALIPCGIILTIPGETDDEIRLIRDDVLRAKLAPASVLSPPDVWITDIPPLLLHTLAQPVFDPPLPDGHSSYPKHRMEVHESPLTAGTYRLWVYASNSYYPPSSHPAYHLGPRSGPDVMYGFTFFWHGANVQWRETRPALWSPHEITGGMAYSGHSHTTSECQYPQELILPPLLGTQGGLVHLVDAGECRMMPYSGALTFATSDAIFIQYFK